MILSFLPNILLFICIIFLGTLISLSANNIILIWIGLELNIIAFIPILNITTNNQETVASIKYFFIQSIASGVILTAIIIIHWPFNYTFINSSILFIIAMLIKLGLPPCHFWYPSVMASINYLICLILSTWQKITPLLLIMCTFPVSNIIIMSLLTAILIRSFGGFNQTQLRSLLAYSSIGHIAWILCIIPNSFSCSLIYLIFYLIISFSLFYLLIKISIFSIGHLKKTKLDFILLFIILILILSLRGLPPFTGFFPKWITLEFLISTSPLFASFLLLMSIANLSYYLNLRFMSYFANFSFSAHFSKINPLLVFSSIISLFALPILFF